MTSNEPKRVGIYGGTFNPPHIGHIHAAKEFLEIMKLDELLIMPAAVPPHKVIEGKDDPSVRLEMCREAFGGISDKVTVSDYEIKKGGISYTVETLEHYAKEGTKLFFLCGADMFLTLETWNMPEKIFKNAAFVCAMRGDGSGTADDVGAYSSVLANKFNAEVFMLPSAAVRMSSSEIRDLIKHGGDISGMVTDGVGKIIHSRRLYL